MSDGTMVWKGQETIESVGGIYLAAEPLSKSDVAHLLEEAEFYADAIRDRIVRLYFGRAWETEGFESWAAFCSGDHRMTRLRDTLSSDLRREVVQMLTQAQIDEKPMSQRQIAEAVGVSQAQVNRIANDKTGHEAADTQRITSSSEYTRTPSKAEQRALAAKTDPQPEPADPAVRADPIPQGGIPVTEPIDGATLRVIQGEVIDSSDNPYPHYGKHIINAMDGDNGLSNKDRIDAALAIIKDLNTAIQTWKTRPMGAAK